jgi:hypothetical protein
MRLGNVGHWSPLRRLLQIILIGCIAHQLLEAALWRRDLEDCLREEVVVYGYILIAVLAYGAHRHAAELPSLQNLLAANLMIFAVIFVVTNSIRCGRCQGRLTGCKSNLKSLATSCEMYSTDNCGHYPHSLDLLTPNYLRKIPRCPQAHRDTYSARYAYALTPDAYTVCCGGCYHHAAGLDTPNYPHYSSFSGLILP